MGIQNTETGTDGKDTGEINMDGYEREGYSKYSMKVYLIFVTKYRKKLFRSQRYADDVKQFLYDAAKQRQCKIVQMKRWDERRIEKMD